MKIIGIERVSYISKDDRKVDGYKIHCIEPLNDKKFPDRVVGSKAVSLYFNMNYLPEDCLKVLDNKSDLVGKSIVVYYNEYRNPVYFSFTNK